MIAWILALAALASIVAVNLLPSKEAQELGYWQETKERMAVIEDALELYQLTYGKMPCPAKFNDNIGSKTYGEALSPCHIEDPDSLGFVNASNDGIRLSPSKIAAIGNVPFRTLNLTEDYMEDAWGGRFVYAVEVFSTQALTESGNQLLVRRLTGHVPVYSDGTPQFDITQQRPVATIVSPGPNGNGATKRDGTTALCNGVYQDSENCNGDDVFFSDFSVPKSQGAYDDLTRVFVYPKNCKTPNLYRYTQAGPGTVYHGSARTLSCSDGHGTGNSTIYCLNGEWQGPDPGCN